MKKSKLEEDMSIYEASEFWDEHDMIDRDDVQEVKDIQFMLKKKKYVGLDSSIYEKISRKAKKLKMSEDTLINDWLREKVEA